MHLTEVLAEFLKPLVGEGNVSIGPWWESDNRPAVCTVTTCRDDYEGLIFLFRIVDHGDNLLLRYPISHYESDYIYQEWSLNANNPKLFNFLEAMATETYLLDELRRYRRIILVYDDNKVNELRQSLSI